ncbi:error-prone DNA polymerase [Salaquimonas pukyongi]|uniref:error-prone DNA polymerase n=1 Tax=Salaquimonas pukyongi TaxID=2712698 RepID=UPI00096BAB25|nr:error-prone DNA polymerase [Salaquimonas pukyongi]
MTPETASKPGYVELCATSNFSFLRGASHPEELVQQAKKLGLAGIAITDRNSLAGIVRGHMAAKEAGIEFVTGCRLVFMDGTPDILIWPKDRKAYGNLCELLSLGKRRAPKGECHLTLQDLLAWGGRCLLAVVPADSRPGPVEQCLEQLHRAFPGHAYLALCRRYGAGDQRHFAAMEAVARKTQTPLLAIGDVFYHVHERRALQDVVTCIREHETLTSIGTRLLANAERHLKAPAEMLRLFKGYEQAIQETGKLVARIGFSLNELSYQYPDDPVFRELGGKPVPSQEALERLTAIGLKKRYPGGPPQKVLDAIAHETALIGKLNYAPYFLTVYDIVRFARSKGILCQGRGSAANSAICYCLEITEVDPGKVDLLFERFISEERNEPPDIDVDFEHERREEVIQYIYEKYGREKAGLAATVITYRSKSAIREVGKVFGLSEDAITALSGTRWGSHSGAPDAQDVQRAGLDPKDKHIMQMMDLARQIIGFPRHLSQHVGGFVITRDRLSSLIPIENAAMKDRTIVEWDKDDLESLNMLKIDVLALGMLTCLRKAFAFLKTHYGRTETLSSVEEDDTPTYDMICRADTLGVFQIESRAQMSMLPRLRPRCYYDLVIEVAIVRPGPIQGKMVHPYLKRRKGLEDVSYPKPELKQVLEKTLGVPLFQEQAMNIAIVAARFSPGEADKLRRAMATFRRVGTIGNFNRKMVEGMVANGYERDFAEHCFRQIEGFGDYGFPESHAASFALLVYVSCWLKCHYPDVFCAAMLNSQPMGFYAPAQLIRDAREHGVEIRPADINHSSWHSTLEAGAEPCAVNARHQEMAGIMKNTHAVRLGLHQIKGLGETDAERLVEARAGGYANIRDVWMRSGLSKRALEKLADADCFASIGLSRRDALWAVKTLDPLSAAERLPLFAAASQGAARKDLQSEPAVALPLMPGGEEVISDYRSLSFSLKDHPMRFLRRRLLAHGCVENVCLEKMRTGMRVKVAGLVLVRQRPGTAKGVIFETIEDETGIANIIIWRKVFDKFRTIVLGSRCIGVRGKLQNEDGVVHLVAEYLEDLTPMLSAVVNMDTPLDGLARADALRKPVYQTGPGNRPRRRLSQVFDQALESGRKNDAAVSSTHQVLPKGRNFH